MQFISRILEKIKYSDYSMVVLLMGAAFFSACGLSLCDIGITVPFITNEFSYFSESIFYIALSFAVTGLLLFYIKKQQVYHGIFYLSVVTILFGLLLIFPFEGKEKILFIFKYILFLFYNSIFFVLLHRYNKIEFNSFFPFVLGCEFLGYMVSGILNFNSLNILNNLKIGFISLSVGIGLTCLFIYLNPIAKIVFLRTRKHNQDSENKKLLLNVWFLSFLVFFALGIVNYLFYSSIYNMSVDMILLMLGCFWFLFGFGCLSVFLVFKYVFSGLTSLYGIYGVIFSLFLVVLGALCKSTFFIYIGSILFCIFCYLYMSLFSMILLNPLTIGKRLPENRIRYGLICPLGIGLSGVILASVDSYMFLGIFLFFLAVFILLSVLRALKIYTQVILKSLQLRLWRESPVFLISKTLKYVVKSLQTKQISDIAYFLSILEKNNKGFYHKYLYRFLSDDDENIRIHVLERLKNIPSLNQFLPLLEKMITEDPSNEVRNLSLFLVIRYKHKIYPYGGVDRYIPYMIDKKLKKGAISGFVSLGGEKTLMGILELQKLAFSNHVSDNVKAAQIVQMSPHIGFVNMVDNLLKRPSQVVVKEALLAAGEIQHPLLLPLLFQALDDLELKETALSALKKYGKRAFPPLEKALEDEAVPLLRRKNMVLFLGAISSGEGKKLLLRALDVPNQELRKTILQLLISEGICWVHPERKRLLRKMIEEDVNKIETFFSFINDLNLPLNHEAEESLIYLKKSFEEEIKNLRELILYQLEVLIQNSIVHSAIRVLLMDRSSEYEIAASVIQDLIPASLFKKIKPILLNNYLETQENKEFLTNSELTIKLADILKTQYVLLSGWSKSLILYVLRKLNSQEGLDIVKESLKEDDVLVLETALWALVRLEKNKKVLHHLLLKVPTSKLAGQDLAKILES